MCAWYFTDVCASHKDGETLGEPALTQHFFCSVDQLHGERRLTSPDEGEIWRDLLPEDGSCPPTARAEGEPVPVSGYRAKQMWPDVATQQTPVSLDVHLWLRLDAEESAGRRCSGRRTLNIRAESGLRSTLCVCAEAGCWHLCCCCCTHAFSSFPVKLISFNAA